MRFYSVMRVRNDSILVESASEINPIRISNLMGQLSEVQTPTFIQNKADFSLDLAPGMYSVRLISIKGSEEHLVRAMKLILQSLLLSTNHLLQTFNVNIPLRERNV
jgi:hypothetical protein